MTNNKPRVSIGLPVFNSEKYLEEALDSILAQTYTDFELIISDNASTDRTQAICQAYATKDRRIRYYRNEKNLGAAPNFNRAFSYASSEYFKWSPYDDLIAPDFLLRCVEVLDQHPEVVLCYSRAQVLNEHSEVVTTYDPSPDTSSLKAHERFYNLILKPHLAVQQMGLIRADVLKKTDLHGSYPSSDEVLLADLALRGQYYEIPERLYFYRLHPEQPRHGPAKTQRSLIPIFDTSLIGKIVLPKWLYFFACLKAIKRAPLGGYERAYCYRHMGRWLLVPPHFRAMGKDLLLAAKQVIVRVFSHSDAETQQTIQTPGKTS